MDSHIKKIIPKSHSFNSTGVCNSRYSVPQNLNFFDDNDDDGDY